MGTFTFNLPGAQTLGTSINKNLYAGTKDEDLTYNGSDYIVWDRVNSERLRRGLPSLTDIGYPRPPEDPTTPAPLPPTKNGSAQTFEVKGPPGLTFEQAKAIFDKQVSTGALVGYKPGEVLSSATQAAAGLPGAQSQLTQTLSGITGALGAGIPGSTQAIGTATQLAGSVNPLSSVKQITNAITTTNITAPIDVADFAKTTTALNKIKSMSVSTVTAVVAQAKNLVGQLPNVVSNTKGVGAVGLNLQQLETAGLIKPGTNAQATALGGATVSLASVLKSPSVWTGKDGISNLGSLTSNPAKQEAVLQGLMSKGLTDLAAVGVPVNSLSPQSLAGTALNAAKSVPATEAFLKGLPIPGDSTGEIKASFNTNIRDGAFAANLAETKIPNAFKEVDFPIPADNTVNRDTLNAAASRIVGNPKVPVPNYGAVTKFERSLYANAKDAELVYAGDDYIVWDRINSERLARGLPGLAEIGYPRPPEETAADRERRQQQQASG